MVFGIILVLVLVACSLAVGMLHATAGAVSIIIATGSLAVAGANAYITLNRNKKKDTIAAWSDWSEKSFERRNHLGQVFGIGPISDDQVYSLASGQQCVVDRNGRVLNDEQSEQIRRDVTATLNQLERFAMGAKYGLYDDGVVQDLGSAIIIRNYERFSPYIAVLQQRNSAAYTEIGRYANRLESRLLKTKRKRLWKR